MKLKYESLIPKQINVLFRISQTLSIDKINGMKQTLGMSLALIAAKVQDRQVIPVFEIFHLMTSKHILMSKLSREQIYDNDIFVF